MDEFVVLLEADCDEDVARFLWDELIDYWRPLTPHPDDDILADLLLDDEEPNDWLAEFCDRNDLRLKDIALWPQHQVPTARNFARWLSSERQRLRTKLPSQGSVLPK